MAQLGVGRSTVREALQILTTLNIVDPRPGQGTYIKRPTAEEVLRFDLMAFLIGNPMALELLEAREMIEPHTARLACLRGTDRDFERIEDLLVEHERAHAAGLPVSTFAARFHVLVAEASHNRVAVIFMKSILEFLLQRGRRFDHIPDYQAQEIREHRQLLRVIRSGHAEEAAQAMLQHIIESATTYDTGGQDLAAQSPQNL